MPLSKLQQQQVEELCPVLAEALRGDLGLLAAQGGSQHQLFLAAEQGWVTHPADRKHPMDCGTSLPGKESSGAHMRIASEPVVAIFMDLNTASIPSQTLS